MYILKSGGYGQITLQFSNEQKFRFVLSIVLKSAKSFSLSLWEAEELNALNISSIPELWVIYHLVIA